MATTVATLTGVVVGEKGKTIILTCYDDDGNVQDISAYTGTKTLYFRSPDGVKDGTATLTFTAGGSDGRVQFSFAAADIDRPGDWQAQVNLTISTTIIARSDPFIIRVTGGLA